MTNRDEPTGGFDPLDRIIADYFEALEAGQEPSRQRLLEQHVEMANRLRAFFADFDAVGQDASKFRLPLSSRTAETITHGKAAPVELPRIQYLGDYELLHEIARGGMGVVYRARQVSLNRPVAIKMILAGTYATAESVQRFRAEAEAAANLDHPNILPIYEVGEHEGHQYFSMKLVEGGSLSARVGELKAKPGKTATFMSTLARAVHFAHQRGILHRDLKPANVLIDQDGTPFITDFGLAKKVDADDGSTQTGSIVGTPSYMAPEQARGQKGLTTSVDVYSLGAILYELLTGQPPFKGETILATIQQVMEIEATDPRKVNPSADRDLSVIALKCLNKDSSRRYGSAAELADDLDRWQRREPILARPVGRVERVKMWMRRNPGLTASLFGTYLALMLGLGFVLYGQRQAQKSLEVSDRLYRITKDHEIELMTSFAQTADALSAEKQASYNARISLALNEWQANNPARADQLMNEGIAEIRGWEWGFLRRMMHLERLALTVDAKGISAFAYSPDSTKLFSAGFDNSIRIWDAVTGKLVRKLDGHTSFVRGFIFVSEKQLLSYSAKETVVWNLETGQKIDWDGYSSGALGMVRHRDGRVAVLRSGKRIELYAPGQKTPLWSVPGSELDWDTQGNFLVTVAEDQVVVRDPKTGTEQSKLPIEGKPINTLRLSPTGKRLAAKSEDRLYVWDLPSGKLILEQKLLPITLSWSTDGHRLAVGLAREVRFWDFERREEMPRLRGLKGYVTSTAFSPDGQSFMAATGDLVRQGLIALDPEDLGAQLAFAFIDSGMATIPVELRFWSLPVPDYGTPLLTDDRPVNSLAVGPNGIIAVGRATTIELRSIRDPRYVRIIPIPENASTALSISSDGKWIIAGGQDSVVRVWDSSTGEPSKLTYRCRNAIETICSLSHSNSVAIANAGDGAVVVWDFLKGEEQSVSYAEASGKSHLAVGHRLPLIVRSSTGTINVSTDLTYHLFGAVYLVDSKSGLPIRGLDPTTGYVNVLALSLDDKRIATISGKGISCQTLQIFDSETGKEQSRFLGDSETSTCVCFTPDHKRLVVGSDASLKIWDIQSGKLILSIPKGVSRLEFTPDGSHLIALSGNQVLLFDAGEPTPLLPLPEEKTVLVKGEDPPLSTDAKDDPFPKPARVTLNRAEACLIQKDFAGAWLHTLHAAEVDSTDPQRGEFYSRALNLYHQRLPKLGGTIPNAVQTLNHPESPSEAQQLVILDSSTGLMIKNQMYAKPHRTEVYDLETKAVRGVPFEVEGGGKDRIVPYVLPFSDGKRLLVSSQKQNQKESQPLLNVVDMTTGKPVGPVIDLSQPGRRHIRAWLSLPEDGKHVVVDERFRDDPETTDGFLFPAQTRAWNLETGKPLTLPTKFHRLAFSPDGRYVLAAWLEAPEKGKEPTPSRVYDLTTLQPVGEPILLKPNTAYLHLTREGRFVVATDQSSAVTLRAYETKTGQCTLAYRYGSNQLYYALAHHTDRVAVQSKDYHGKSCIEVRNLADGKREYMGTTLLDSIHRLAFSPDDRFILVHYWDTIHLIDSSKVEPIGPPLVHTGYGRGVERWAPDYSWMYLAKQSHLWTQTEVPEDLYLKQTRLLKWDLSAPPMQPAESRERAELHSGRTLDSEGIARPIPLEEYRKRWVAAKAAHPEWFDPTAAAEGPVRLPKIPVDPTQAPAKSVRPELKPDYATILRRYPEAGQPPLVSIADAMTGLSPANRLAAIKHLVEIRPDSPMTGELLLECFKDPKLNENACNLCEELGARARPILPGLVAELELQLKHGPIQKSLIRTFGKIGPDAAAAIPILREIVAETPATSFTHLETEAIRSLGRIGPDAVVTLAVLVSRLAKLSRNEKDFLLLQKAIERISLGHETILIDELTKVLAVANPQEEKDSGNRASVREACCRLIVALAPKLKGIEPAIRKVLAEPIPESRLATNHVRPLAVEALWQMEGPSAEVLKQLETELKQGYITTPVHGITNGGVIARVAGRIGEPAKPFLPLIEKVGRNDLDAVEVGYTLWKLTGKPDQLLGAAKKILEEKSYYYGVSADRKRVMQLLGEVGPPAKVLAPQILQFGLNELTADAQSGFGNFRIIPEDEEDPDPNLDRKFLPWVREALRKVDPDSVKKLDRPGKK